jgi:hypothetical protein
MIISNKEKLRILKQTRKELLRKLKEGTYIGDMLEIVNERIDYYSKLCKQTRFIWRRKTL